MCAELGGEDLESKLLKRSLMLTESYLLNLIRALLRKAKQHRDTLVRKLNILNSLNVECLVNS